jgi:hypothetical protein
MAVAAISAPNVKEMVAVSWNTNSTNTQLYQYILSWESYFR